MSSAVRIRRFLSSLLVLIGGLSFVSVVSSYFVPETDPASLTAERQGSVLRSLQTEGMVEQVASPTGMPQESPLVRKLVADEFVVDPSESAILEALQHVPLTPDGSLVVDHRGLEALYALIGYGAQTLTDWQLIQLERIIRKGLPGKAGEEAVRLVLSFHQYLQGKKAVDSLYSEVRSPDQLELKLRELDALRNTQFGEADAQRLFARQRAHEKYMLNDMMISQDEGLTEEEKQVRRDSMEELLLAEHPDIFNWHERYSAFLMEKQEIIDASIPEDDKAEQINSLYYEHFSEEERLQIARLDLLDY